MIENGKDFNQLTTTQIESQLKSLVSMDTDDIPEAEKTTLLEQLRSKIVIDTSEMAENLHTINTSIDSLLETSDMIKKTAVEAWWGEALSSDYSRKARESSIMEALSLFPKLDSRENRDLIAKLGDHMTARLRLLRRWKAAQYSLIYQRDRETQLLVSSEPEHPGLSYETIRSPLLSQQTRFRSFLTGLKHGMPPLSSIQGEINEFACLWCGLQLKNCSQEDWEAHFLHDLRPYLCTFAECSRLFASETEWFKHEQSHHRGFWQCPSCDAKSDTATALQLHLFREHKYSGTNELLDTLSVTCRRPQSRFGPDDCSFCNHFVPRFVGYDSDSSASTTCDVVEFRRHVAGHMERLALLALKSKVKSRLGPFITASTTLIQDSGLLHFQSDDSSDSASPSDWSYRGTGKGWTR